MPQHRRQAAAAGLHAARAHAFQLDAVAVKMHDVRAVFVGHPKCAVLHYRQPFAVDASFVALQRLAIGIYYGFFGRAVAGGVGQSCERFAVFVFQRNVAQFFNRAVGLDFKMSDAGRKAGQQEDFDVFAAVGIGAAVG